MQNNQININRVNQKIKPKNRQKTIQRRTIIVAIIAASPWLLYFVDENIVHPAILFLGLIIAISAVVVSKMFKCRSNKLQTLITGENLIASWILNPRAKKQYAKHLFQQEQSRNLLIYLVIAFFVIVVFGAFVIFGDSDIAIHMFLSGVGLLALLAIFAFGMPYYYRYQNLKQDGYILIGKKYAYVNGYFHNWDFPLSGINKVKIITDPFYGLHIQYYYTDRTLLHKETIEIPANATLDLRETVELILNG